MWQIWLIIAGLFFIGEIITVGFLVFWFGVGALIAMVSSFFITNIIIQMAIFVLSSAILLFATKPFVKKFAYVKPTKTNAYSIIGKKALVIKEINSHSIGQIKIKGETWSAESEDDETIPQGADVEIIQIRGVKAIVKQIQKTEFQKLEDKIKV